MQAVSPQRKWNLGEAHMPGFPFCGKRGAPLTKAELVLRQVAAHPRLTARQARIVVWTFFNQITAALCRGDRTDLRGFGSFGARRTRARDGRNPHR
jgi:nucleoid DNA-binding protein